MKKLRCLLLLLMAFCLPVFAAPPSPFGMPLGELTLNDATSRFSLQSSGVSPYSGGSIMTAPVAQFDFEGLVTMQLIFDQDERLVAVIATLDKQRFDTLFTGLDERYRSLSSQRPFVGNKSATFESGDTEIHLEAPHMSFQMTMSYLQKSFLQAYREQTAEAERRQQQHEMNQL